ncbi:MAG: hypothetical protein ACRDBH_08210 [Bosea sp. (in: a-proteobacteria)]
MSYYIRISEKNFEAVAHEATFIPDIGPFRGSEHPNRGKYGLYGWAVGSPADPAAMIRTLWNDHAQWRPRVATAPTWWQLAVAADTAAWACSGSCGGGQFGPRIMPADNAPWVRLAATLVAAGVAAGVYDAQQWARDDIRAPGRRLRPEIPGSPEPGDFEDREAWIRDMCRHLDETGQVVPPSLWDALGVHLPC